MINASASDTLSRLILRSERTLERLPPIYVILDSMFESWLNISTQGYEDIIRLALYISRLIDYCYISQL